MRQYPLRLAGTIKYPLTGAVTSGAGSMSVAGKLKWAVYDPVVITGIPQIQSPPTVAESTYLPKLTLGVNFYSALHKLGAPEALRRSLSSTNLIESCFSMTRHITGQVKRWRGGDQVQRWAATALLEAEKRFRRI